MAESILFNVAASLIAKLGSPPLAEFQLLWGLDDELDKLKHTISAMEAALLDAEEQQFKSHEVKNWISRVKDAFYDVDDLIDEFAYETLRRQVIAKSKRGAKEVKVLTVLFLSPTDVESHNSSPLKANVIASTLSIYMPIMN